jgi:IS1 family transposase
MPKNDRIDDATTFRKILSFATSAGVTITNRDALEVIKSLCHERLGTNTRAAAIARHALRVSDTLGELDRG